jgi:hypothetical protein
VTESTPLHTHQQLANGTYRQVITTDQLSEGYHYLSVICFRHRGAGTDPIYTDFRKVIYIDRQVPASTLAESGQTIDEPIHTYRAVTVDRTVNRVHIIANPPGNPVLAANASNQAARYDRSEWRRSISGLHAGANTIAVVSFELSGRGAAQTFTVNTATGSGDINGDGVVTIDDLYAGCAALGGPYLIAGDVNGDGLFNLADLRALETSLRPAELEKMAQPQR